MEWKAVVLETWQRGQTISAVGPGPVEEHFEHAQRWAERIDAGTGPVLDLGSGAGIPGLALAGLLPDRPWVLVDAALRRTRLLSDAVDRVGWSDRVTVIHERAELLPSWGLGDFAVVVARLFGRPAVTAECAAPLLAPGGQLLVSEPAQPADAERWNETGLASLGLSLGQHWSQPEMQELRRTGDPEVRFPRKPGVAAKRPLWP